ncbi:ABC transporter permease [Antrihabitans stalactiti]|uniref:Antibiotic transporter n=1 Tax=Antrihabitans stalactiti TaxID=2584121 RepID=A0A848KP93_9NOCA|nr:ABC transporter permease [Antrihabitans stalactiti]NMN98110.1 antibiotic transporter [Antrihabitans stalactiti]
MSLAATVARRPEPTAIRQWWVLTVRLTQPSLRNGEMVLAALAPPLFTLGFYVPLNIVMSVFGHGLSSYAQFLMPIIVLQSLGSNALTAAFRSASDAADGMNQRFNSMPIGRLVPLAARTAMNVFRAVVSVIIAIISGYVIGFRFANGALHTVGFCLFALAVATALSLGADVLGSLSRSPEATTQSLALPMLILGMLSTGFAPARQFPEWIQPFTRNQPISQFVYALRALAGDTTSGAGSVSWALMGPPLAWVIAMVVVFVPLSIIVSARRA